jgi:amino acid adenylation domain-containing protein
MQLPLKSDFIHQIIEKQAGHYPDRTAVSDGYASISYKQLNRKANQLANLLIILGVTHETIVGVLNIPNVRLITSMLGILKTGGIYMPLDWGFSQKRFEQLFTQTFDGYLIINEEDSEAVSDLISVHKPSLKFLISVDRENVLKVFRYMEGKLIGELAGSFSHQDPQVTMEPDAGNYIFYTSGSTGEGKAILGCHKSIAHYINWAVREFDIDCQSKIAHLSQAGFDASIKETLMALCTGGTLVIPPPSVKGNILMLTEWLDQQEISIMVCIPSIFRLILKTIESQTIRTKFSKLKIIMLSGEMLYAKDVHHWRTLVGNAVQLVNLYGTTETTIIDTFYRINDISDNPGQIIPAGYPIDNTFVIVAKDEQLCKIGETGEIFIKTSYPTKGYLNNERLTAEAFVQNPLVKDRKDIVYKTGDIGRYLPNRCLEVLGRMDSQVKVNGIRIELGEVQQAVLSLAGISEAVVMVRKDRNDQNDLTCYYISDSIDVGQLRLHLMNTLNKNVVPSYLIKMEEFPLNMNGKVDRKKLPDPGLSNHDDSYEAPANEIEGKLEILWEEILTQKKIGRNLSFFHAGGNSLKALQLISRIYKTFEVNLDIKKLFEYPTIALLAEIIASGTRVELEKITPAPLKPLYDLSPAQKSMWLDMNLKQNSNAYHMQVAYTVEGHVNSGALRKAFHTIIMRHESLRTVFIHQYEEPKQLILNSDQFMFDKAIIELSDSFYSQTQVDEIIREDFCQKLNLEEGPLIKVKFVALEKSRQVLVLTLHHLIADGYSLEVLKREFLNLYNMYCDEPEIPLAPLALQYKDYSEWQIGRESGTDVVQHKKYWSEQLGCPPVPELPFGLVTETSQKFRGEEIYCALHPGLVEKLRIVAESQEVTPFMVLLTAVNALIYRHTGQNDIIVGSPVSGRNYEVLEEQIGLFVNMIAIRNKVNGNETLSELLGKVRSVVLDGYSHQDYPYESVVRDLRQTAGNHVVLFEIVVAMFSEGRIATSAKDMLIQEIKIENDTAKFNLTFHFYERKDEIFLYAEFNSNLFTRASIQQLIDHLTTIIYLLCTDSSVNIDEIIFDKNDFYISQKVDVNLDI